jgi:nucleoside-diphosphate-sugar epimerase
MKVAFVDPTGVLGRSLVPLLLKQGHSVRALARSPEKVEALFGQEVEAKACDLLAADTPAHLAEMLCGCQGVMHIATAIPSDFSGPGAWETTTRLRTEGTQHQLGAALEAGLQRYIQQSISLAYPDSGEAWIEEDTPLDTSPDRTVICGPVIRMESMVRATPTRDLEWCILRGGTFVGPGTFQERTAASLMAGREKVPCDGSNYVSAVHVGDMASAYAAAMVRPVAGAILNVNAEPLRQGQYLDGLAQAVGARRPERDPDAPCPPSLRCSNQAARKLLEWEPVHRLYPGEDQIAG